MLIKYKQFQVQMVNCLTVLRQTENKSEAIQIKKAILD